MTTTTLCHLLLSAVGCCSAVAVAARDVTPARSHTPQPPVQAVADNTRLPAAVSKYAATNRPAPSERLFTSEAVEAEIARIKALLTEIFGGENDFDKVLEGVNLAGTGANGKRVVQNLLDALTPVLQDGAAQHLQTTAANARAEADTARAAREQA